MLGSKKFFNESQLNEHELETLCREELHRAVEIGIAEAERGAVELLDIDAIKREGRQSTSVDQSEVKSSLFSRLKQIKISAPPDFSENIDAYFNGEKKV
jgi:hypothetical protein